MREDNAMEFGRQKESMYFMLDNWAKTNRRSISKAGLE